MPTHSSSEEEEEEEHVDLSAEESDSSSSDAEEDLIAMQRFASIDLKQKQGAALSAAAKKAKRELNAKRRAEKQAKQQVLQERARQSKTQAQDRLLHFSLASLQAAEASASVKRESNALAVADALLVEAEDFPQTLERALQVLAREEKEGGVERAMADLKRVAARAEPSLAIRAKQALAKECAKRLLLREAINYYHQILDAAEGVEEEAVREKAREDLRQAYLDLGATTTTSSNSEGDAFSPAELDATLERALVHNDLEELERRCFTMPQVMAHHAHGRTGVTALHVACGKNQLHLVHHLIGVGGADWRRQDAQRMNSFAWALRFMPENDDMLCRELVATYGAVVDPALSNMIQTTWPSSVQQRVNKFLTTLA